MTTLTNPQRAVLVALDYRTPQGAQASLLLDLPDVDLDVLRGLYDANLMEGDRAPDDVLSDRRWKRGSDVPERRDTVNAVFHITGKGESVVVHDGLVQLLRLLCSAPRWSYSWAHCLRAADQAAIDVAFDGGFVSASDGGAEVSSLKGRHLNPDRVLLHLQRKAERILGAGMMSR